MWQGGFGGRGWSQVDGECSSYCGIYYEILLWTLVILLHYCVLAVRRYCNGYLVPTLLFAAINAVSREHPHTAPNGDTEQQHHSVTPATEVTIAK